MATEGGPGTSRKFKAFDIYKNPKNLEIAPVEDYVEECRRQRRYQQAEREKRMKAKGADRHPDWSPLLPVVVRGRRPKQARESRLWGVGASETPAVPSQFYPTF